VQLFGTSKRADLDGPHYPRQSGRWHLIARHDLLFLFSEGGANPQRIDGTSLHFGKIEKVMASGV
jgi:hypothetical protein